MAIPAQVRAAGKEADEALQALAASINPPAPNPDEPPADPPVDLAASNPPPTPAPPQAPTVQPTSADAELARLQQELSTAKGREAARDRELAELRGQVQTLTQVAQRPAEPPKPPAPQSLITDEDRKDFGEDMIDLVQRLIRQDAGNTLTQLTNRLTVMESKLDKLGKSTENVAQSAADARFAAYLKGLDDTAPGWRDTNEEQKFLDWLEKADKFSRKSRGELLADAHNRADHETVANFFKAYWAESGVTPAEPAAPTPTPPAQPVVDPQSLVSPTPVSAPTPSANPRAGRIWTQAEVEKVYDDRVHKRITAERFAQLEAEITAAVVEGRVR